MLALNLPPTLEPPGLGDLPAKVLPVFGSPGVRFFALFHDGGPDASSRFRSSIGGLLPIALCGRTSL
jgi:hypothetical protein